MAGAPLAVSSGSLTTHTVWHLSRSWFKQPLGAGASTASWVTSSLTSLARPTFPATSSTWSRRQTEFGLGSQKPPALAMAPTLRSSHAMTQILQLGAEMWGSVKEGVNNIICLFQSPVPCVSFRSNLFLWCPTLPSPRPYSSLAFCTATSHTTSRGQYTLYFLSQNWRLNTDHRLPSPKLPAQPLLLSTRAFTRAHKGSLGGGSLQVTVSRYIPPRGRMRTAGSRQCLAGSKLALDVLVSQHLLLAD